MSYNINFKQFNLTMGKTEGVKGAWRINFFIFLLTGSQSVLLPWTPIILKSAGIEAAGTGLTVGLSIIFSSLGVGITLAILRRTYSGAIRRIILLVLLLTSTIFYITSVFLIPVQNNEQSCYNYESIMSNPVNSLVAEPVLSNMTASSISDDHANSHITAPPNIETTSEVYVKLFTYTSTVSEKMSTPTLSKIESTNKSQENENLNKTSLYTYKSTMPEKASTPFLSKIESTNESQGDEHLNKTSLFTLPATQTPLILNSIALKTNLTTKQMEIVTEIAKTSTSIPNERNNTKKSTIVPATVNVSTINVTISPNKYTNKSKTNHVTNNKTDKKHKFHKSPGRNVNLIGKSIAADTHIVKPEESIVPQSTDERLDNSDLDDGIEENESYSYDQDDYQEYNLQGDSNFNRLFKPSNNLPEVNIFDRGFFNEPILTHNRKSNKIPILGESDFRNSLQSNQNPYSFRKDIVGNNKYNQRFQQEGINRDNKGLLDNINYNQRSQQEDINRDNKGFLDNINYNQRSQQEGFNMDNKGLVGNSNYNQRPQQGVKRVNKGLTDNNNYKQRPQQGFNRDGKGIVGNSKYNIRPQHHTILKVPPLNQYIENHQRDQINFLPSQNKNNLHNVHKRQRRSPAIRKDFTFNTSDSLTDSIKTKKDGLQIDISSETVKTVANAGIAALLIIGGILGSGIEAAVAQLWHCYAHGYDEGGVSHDILERTITHTFHVSVYPQHRRWSTITAGCWAVLGGMMSAIGCSLGSSSGLWTGQAALHLAMALLAFCAIMIIPVPYGTVDPPKTRRPLSLYLDDEVLREGLRRLAFHGWILLSGVISSMSITFGLWLIQETAYTKGLSFASQACAVFLRLASEGMTLHLGHWIVSRGGVLGTMCVSGVALSLHCGVLWAASDVWLMALAHITAGISTGCLWLAVKHNSLLLATINDQEREAWVSWCSWRGGMGIGAMLWGSWAGGLSGALKPLFAAAGAVALLQAIAVSISWILGRKQIRSRRRIYHTLDLDMEDEDAEDEDDDEEDWLVKRAKKEGIVL